MDKLADLRQRAKTLSDEIQAVINSALSEKRALTDDENKLIKGKRDELEPLIDTIRTADAAAQFADDLATPTSRAEGPAAGAARPASNVRVGNDREAGKPFTELGEQLMAVRAFATGMTDHPDVKRLRRLNDEIRAASGMSESVPSDGGFAVQNDFAEAIIGRIFGPEAPGAIASRVMQITLGANANGFKQNVIDEKSRVNGSRWGGVQAYWANEADTVTATKPKLRQMQMDLEKLFAIWYLTDELSQDATAMSSVAQTAFAEELQFKVEDGVINGTGVGQMLGILSSPALVTQAIEATQTIANTATFIATNVAKMFARFSGSEQRAVWLANRSLLPKLVTATLGGTTVPVYLPGGVIAGTPFGTVLGIPMVFAEYCAAEGTPGDLILADLGWYAQITKGAPRFAMSMHVRFLNDENAFRVTYRTNGQPIPDSAITPYKGTDTRSPFVVLNTRS